MTVNSILTTINHKGELINDVHSSLDQLKKAFQKNPAEKHHELIQEIFSKMIKLREFDESTNTNEQIIKETRYIKRIKRMTTTSTAITFLSLLSTAISSVVDKSYHNTEANVAVITLDWASLGFCTMSIALNQHYEKKLKQFNRVKEEIKRFEDEQVAEQKYEDLLNAVLKLHEHPQSPKGSRENLLEKEEEQHETTMDARFQKCLDCLKSLPEDPQGKRPSKEDWIAGLISTLPKNHILRQEINRIHQVAEKAKSENEEMKELELEEASSYVEEGAQETKGNEFDALWKRLEDRLGIGQLESFINSSTGDIKKITRKGGILNLPSQQEHEVTLHINN